MSASDARARFAAGDLAGAIELARSAGPGEPTLDALRHVSSGRWADGLAAAEAALRSSRDPALALWCRAEARLGLGDRAGALADTSRVLDLVGVTCSSAWKDRAVLRALDGDRAGALADLARAAALAPDDVVPHLWTAGLGGSTRGLSRFVDAGHWSTRLGELVLGRASAADLLAEASDARARCQVHGYAGLIAERDGAPARSHYEACVATEVWHFLTHKWARSRLAGS